MSCWTCSNFCSNIDTRFTKDVEGALEDEGAVLAVLGVEGSGYFPLPLPFVAGLGWGGAGPITLEWATCLGCLFFGSNFSN